MRKIDRHTHGPKTYVRGLWLIAMLKRGYSFKVKGKVEVS